VLRFVITIGGHPPAEVREYLAGSASGELSYVPSGRFGWRSRDDQVNAAGWWTGAPDHAIDNTGLTMWGGNIRIAGSPGAAAAPALRRAIHRDSEDPRLLLRDAYAALTVDADGNGLAFADELSQHPLFVAEPASGITIIGNRPSLVAEIDARWRGTTPTRSIEAAEWMAFAGYIVGDCSGFSGVSRLPQGSLVRIESGRASIVSAEPIFAGDPDDRADLDAFTDRFEEELIDGLRHALAIGDRPQLELTGGKDSRLLFAVAHRARILDEFAVTTYGPTDLPDVRIARELCELVGVPHNHIRSRKSAGADTYPSLERLRRHVHRTCGVSQAADAVEPTPNGPIYVSGLMGEYFRTSHAGDARNPPESAEEAARRFPIQRRFGTAGILRPEALDRLSDVAIGYSNAAADLVRDPADIRPSFTTQFRFPAWQGPLIDRNMNAVLPFANGALVREAFRLPHEQRALELPHRHLMERADRRIADHSFANTTWRTPKRRPKPKLEHRPKPKPAPPRPAPLPPSVDRLRRMVPRPLRRGLNPAWSKVQEWRTPPPAPPPSPPSPPEREPEAVAPAPTPPLEGPSSVRAAHDWLTVNRRDLVALLDADPINPLFETVDFDALRRHISGDGPDDPLARLQVHGAIVAFIWLGAHELPSHSDS